MSLDSLCDMLASEIDDAFGDIDVKTRVDELTSELDDVSVDEFIAAFKNLYECTPEVYAKNAIDDHKWHLDNFEDVDDLFDDDIYSELDIPTSGYDDEY